MKKNVLLIFWGKKGGLPKLTYEIADGCAKAGYNTYAIVSDKIYNRDAWEKNERFKKVVYIYTGDSKKIWLSSIKMLTSTRKKLQEEFKGIQFDISICTMPYPWCYYIAQILNVKRKMILCHDPIAHSGASKLRSYIIRRTTKGYDDVIVMTRSFIPIMSKHYGYKKKQIHFMRHGMYSYGHNFVENSECAGSKINFLFFGSINKYKGIGVLLDAYKIVANKTENVTLTIAGKGSLEEFTKKINGLPRTTIINRFIADEEVGPLFSKTNTVLVLPYLDATQSGVIPVAMEYNTPIIASDTGGLKEQLFDGNLGLFFCVGQSQELAEKMLMFVENKTIMDEQKKLTEYYLKQLDWKEIFLKFMSELEKG